MNPCPDSDRCDDCPDRLVCRCLQVSETALVEVLATREVHTVKDVRRHTGAGDGCTACHKLLKKYIDRYAYSAADSPICSVK